MGSPIDAATRTESPSKTTTTSKLFVYQDPPGATPATVQVPSPKRITRTASTPDDLSVLSLFSIVLKANNRNDENLYASGLVTKPTSQPIADRKPLGLVWSIEAFPTRSTPVVAQRSHTTISERLSQMLRIGKTLNEEGDVAKHSLILVLRNKRFP
ncbi:hypothetical protein FA15DRAFT_658613 [Coprinopsis marcescibilis]|uniref:Uncharacterized protein n=1 Tax=Coprinopsis marcescibilis TaxID=230819 RepID=A0A5C3KLC0_COPMA|nr:hypothetical protein FA15DRAFT_658613 [Coprinopsis marcescibilis]